MGGPTSPVPWANYSVGDVLYWNGTSFVRLAAGTAGQALLSGGAGVAPSWGSAGVTAHSGLTGLTSDDNHTQYALLAGRSGGQTIIGGTASGDDLYLLASTQTGNPAAGVYRTVYIGSDPSAPGTYGIAVSRNGDGGGAGVSVNVMVGAGWNDTFKLTTVGTKYLDWQTGVWTTAGANYNTFAAGGATHVPLAVKGAASQSANLTEWQNSAGAALAAMSATGRLRLFGGGGAGGTAELSFCGSVYNGHIHTGAAGGPTWMVISNGDRSQKTDLTWISPNGTNYYAGSALSMMGQTFTYNTFEASALTPTVVFTATKTSFSVTPAAATTGSPTLLTITGPAHTTLAASTEAIDAYFNLARTVQFATGALTTQRAVVITPPTLAFVGASTVTTAVTLDITGAPVAGTNATITNSYALRVSGAVLLTPGGDKLKVNSTGIGVFAATPVAQQTITGSRGGNAALASLLTALAAFGWIVDSTSA